MARIILTKDDDVLREVTLIKERVTIGRSPHNDIVIDNRAVSAEHAVIVTRDGDSFLEDLNSTNGTNVNGQPIRKHFLQDRDIVELALYRILYLTGSSEGADADDNGGVSLPPRIARIKILNGPNAGKETALSKLLTTIGRPDHQVAVICQQRNEYFLTHVKGDCYPLINGQRVVVQSHPLRHQDVIDLGGVRLQFQAE
jgi:pSer/pThr/pTyr-binding forkhead associated (FHA) protein